jgi:hypothetical protein
MARTSARAKPVDLKKAKFNMKGFFNEAPTVREEAAAVRAEMAYDRNPTALNEQAEKIAHNRAVVAGLERAQQKEPVAKYSEDWMRAREARLQIQMAEGRQNDILAGELADDVSGGIQETQDMTDQMGTAVVDRTPNMTQNTQFPEIPDETELQDMPKIDTLDQGPGASIAGGDTLVTPAPLIQAILNIPENERTSGTWQLLREIGPQYFDVNEAATRETVNPADPDAPPRPGAIGKIQIPYQVAMQMMHDSHAMSRSLQETLDGFAYDNKGVDVEGRRELMLQRAAQGNFQALNVSEYFQMMLDAHEEAGNTGAPSAVSDVLLHSVFHQVKEAYKRIGNPDDIRGREDAINNAVTKPTEDEASQQQFVMAAHERREIGNIAHQAMGIKTDPNNANSTFLGGIAMDVVSRTFPDLFIQDHNGGITITNKGLEVAERLAPMTNIILPSAKVQVRFKKKPDVSVIRPRGAAKVKRGDKGKLEELKYGDYTLQEAAVNLLDNIGYTMDQDMVGLVNILTGSVDSNGKTNIDKLIGTGKEDIGQLNRRSGQRKKKDPKFGRDIIGPDGEPEMEWYPGDRIKDMIFNDNMDWAQQMGNNVFYYDHFPGGNNRFYIKQFIGNFHSHKLPRALLQSDVVELYNTSNESDLNELKAGIVKKFGYDLGVKDAAAMFDREAKGWRTLIANSNTDGASVIDLAAKEDGWASVSAMVEAVRLLDHLDAIENKTSTDPIYASKFLTHVDGTGNGLAHNAMQAGDFETAALTNINPFFDAPEGSARQSVEGIEWDKGRKAITKKDWAKASPLNSDVYHLTGAGMEAQMEGNSNESSPFIRQAFTALGLNDKRTLRQFSKSPLMIFQYGAGRALIKKIVRESILSKLEDDQAMLAAFNSIANEMGSNALTQAEITEAIAEGELEFQEGFKDADYIIDQMGNMMVNAVETNFPMLKELSNILSSMANAATLHGGPDSPGIDLTAMTIGGHHLHFGHSKWEADILRKAYDKTSGIDFTPAQKVLYPQATTQWMKNQQTGKSFPLINISKAQQPNPFYDASWRPTRGAEIFNPKTIPVGSLKAATQAAVLMTHSLDAINVARSMLGFNEKQKKNSHNTSIAQIFDGFLVSPKLARDFAAQLNKDFMDIHLDKGGKHRTTSNDYNNVNDLDLYSSQGTYNFLMNNPNNSNLLLLYRAMARKGFRWDMYRGGGLMDKIMQFEARRIAYREKFNKDLKRRQASVKQFFWD